MEEKFHIEDSRLLTKLNEAYGININSIDFIPMGDSAYSYIVHGGGGQRFYAKLFDLHNDRQRKSAQRLSRYLPLTWHLYHRKLFQNLAYPIKTRHGEWYATFHEVTVALFNYIEGETLADAYPFSDDILRSIAKTTAAIRRTTPYLDPALLAKESYDISFQSDLESCLSLLESAQRFDNESKQSLRELVLPKKELILKLLKLVRELRGKAVSSPADMVLCHGDLWGGNIILRDSEMYVIDWEAAIIAPPEFDLFGYIGAGFDVFLSEYENKVGQRVTIDFDLIRFYCYRRHLRNLTDWLMNILYRNKAKAQDDNDLEMIAYHCMNRWDGIEPNVDMAKAIANKR
ncbi:aminoglycoside phosphotransferase [Gordoniibacillus kamchatkensis]|uniref:Aminoglycoside phosphotransferase n=1 Tax=Gordoniibacillus kamchatkensis TaxID=1590651 RepID=A0ABR5AJB9_9BACL|nr:phosphotransferase [Paenibacillus sp. VKM B-2647]KIL41144.1 aminoglycoside phosphotransferase [Paenibacillus sp. VKM B-2647]